MVRRHLKRARQRYKHLPQSKKDSCLETLVNTGLEFVVGVLSTFAFILPGIYAWSTFIKGEERTLEWLWESVCTEFGDYYADFWGEGFWLDGGIASLVITIYFTITVLLRSWFVRRWFTKHEDHLK